jgi:glycosyltransferase involved in cell wall biosynthesis
MRSRWFSTTPCLSPESRAVGDRHESEAYPMKGKPRRILLLSLYYPPDLSAGSFRTASLVTALREQDPELLIDVVTSAPNRYSSFTSETPEVERVGSLTVRRITLPFHRSGMVDQARAFSHFARQAGRIARHETYDLVYATSSRLMTAALGARISRFHNVPLYLDIRDIFVDTMADILPRFAAVPLGPVLSLVEKRTMRQASHINLVSRGFQAYFQTRYPKQSFSYFTNGIDDEFVQQRPAARTIAAATGPLRVVYAGNMGEGQGLHEIIPTLAKRLEGAVTFRLIGDGGRRHQLESALANAAVTNVTVLPPMSRSALIAEYLEASVLFLHLNDYDAFNKVLPSKIFEYAALGKPIWAGVSGYAADFLRSEVPNAEVFAPCDVEAGVRAFSGLQLTDTPRPDFVTKYARKTIMQAMAADILRRVQPRP